MVAKELSPIYNVSLILADHSPFVKYLKGTNITAVLLPGLEQEKYSKMITDMVDGKLNKWDFFYMVFDLLRIAKDRPDWVEFMKE
jgi:hypothetical protein